MPDPPFVVLLRQVLELRARERTGGAIRALLNMAPKTARRLRPDGSDEEIPLAEVQVGDRLRVRPGDSVPVDGAVLEGGNARLMQDLGVEPGELAARVDELRREGGTALVLAVEGRPGGVIAGG